MTTIREIHGLIEGVMRGTEDHRALARLADAQEDLILAQRALEPRRGKVPTRDGVEDDEPDRQPRRVRQEPANASDGVYVSGDVLLKDVELIGGYRSCIQGWMGTTATHNLFLTNVELVQGRDLGNGVHGTAWGIRDYGVAGGKLEGVDCTGFFSGKGEGHVTYLTLSLGEGDLLEYDRCRFLETGGHGIYHTWRPGNAPEPDGKGQVLIVRCELANTDLDPGRGAYSISLPDTNTSHGILGCTVAQDAPGKYPKHGKYDYAARGLLMAEGRMPRLEVHESHFVAGKSDRYAQVWVEGPELVDLRKTRFDCERVAVNHPYGDTDSTIKTKRLVVKDCTGSAELVWNGEVLGRIDQDYEVTL